MELRPGETIVASVRQHWFVIVPSIIWMVLAVTAMVLMSIYYPIDIFGYTAAAYGVAFLVFLTYLLYRLYIWRKNELIITNLRLIDHYQSGLYDLTVTEVIYRDISDISFTQNGITAAMYDYGTIVVRVPSQEHVEIEMIPSPAKVIETINGLRMDGTNPTVPVPAPSLSP